MSVQIVKIHGMSCKHCVAHVKEALENLPGISQVEVDLAHEQASFETDGATSLADIREALDEAGGYELAI